MEQQNEPLFAVLKNDTSKMPKDMEIIAMSYDFMELQGIDGMLIMIF